MTDKKETIYTRLMEVQHALKTPKNESGRFGMSRSAEGILAQAKPICYSQGLYLNLSDTVVVVDGRHYIEATATVFDAEGTEVSSSAAAWEGEINRGLDASQVTGMASSYARKYALGGLFALDDTKDVDQLPEAEPLAPKPRVSALEPSPRLATPTQKAQITAFMRALSVPDDEIPGKLTDEFGIKDPSLMTYTQATVVLKELE